MMRGLSLYQPWASLVACGAKRFESRSWETSYRGWLAIHATKQFPADAQELCYLEPFKSALWPGATGVVAPLPRGAIVAVCRLAGCAPTDTALVREQWALPLSDERAFGDFSPGRYAWNLCDVRPLPEPLPCVGARGLWIVPPALEAHLRSLLEVAA